jgi:hypothetical protein
MIPIPDLSRVWETFVKIGPDESAREGLHIMVLREIVIPTLTSLRSKGVIGWYGFHIHGRESGVPANEDDLDAYWHIRFELAPHLQSSQALELRSAFVMTRCVPLDTLTDISGLKVSILESPDVRVQWQMIGEISEFVVRLVSFYSAEAGTRQIYEDLAQYVHFLCNACGLWPSPRPASLPN